MAEYIVNPDKLGGGYSDFRIVVYDNNTMSAEDIYQKLKDAKDKGYHTLIHIHLQNIDLGIHSHRYIKETDSFEAHEMYCDYGTEILHLRRYIFQPNKVVSHSKLIDLSKIIILEDKMNQITEEYE